MSITAKDVQTLRDKTGAGMMDCKKALNESGGDLSKAEVWLREKGIANAAKKTGRVAAEGAVFSYIHMGGKIGVLVELNCETDFVARGEKFQQLGKELCQHVCGTPFPPKWIRREDVPADVVAEEKAVLSKQIAESGKPANVVEKIAEGKLNKFYEDFCLLEQPFVKEPKTKVSELVASLSGQIGEKIDVRRFARFVLGEGIEKRKDDFASEVIKAVKDSKGN
jgi:elongation factor Ts